MLDLNPEALVAFRRPSHTHQKEYVGWIESAKREATRESRFTKMAGMLVEGKTNPQPDPLPLQGTRLEFGESDLRSVDSEPERHYTDPKEFGICEFRKRQTR